MRVHPARHLSDGAIRRELPIVDQQERGVLARALALIAEYDERRLSLADGYSSTHAYCVERLGWSEDEAYKRITVARTARRFPRIFELVGRGRLHLTGVLLLAPHLTSGNADELLAAAAGRSKSSLVTWLAERFPRTELLPMIEVLPTERTTGELAPERVGAANGSGELAPERARAGVGFAATGLDQLAPERVDAQGEMAAIGSGELAPERVAVRAPRSRVEPLARGRFALHITIDQATHDDLRRAQELLSHQLPNGDPAAVIARALRLLVARLEQRKFAATDKPRSPHRRTGTSRRHIPARVKRAVWQRDGGQCTFIGEGGHRCSARRLLEFDHVDPVARGGRATVAGIRLRCRAHNQYEAERVFGTDFMRGKRAMAQRAATARAQRTAPRAESARARGPADAAPCRAHVAADTRDVMAGLRELGFRVGESRRAVAFADELGSATLEARMRAALRFLRPRHPIRGTVEETAGAPAGCRAPA